MTRAAAHDHLRRILHMTMEPDSTTIQSAIMETPAHSSASSRDPSLPRNASPLGGSLDGHFGSHHLRHRQLYWKGGAEKHASHHFRLL